MYSYATVIGISIVISVGYSEAYVKCYECGAENNNPSHEEKFDCFGPDMTNVPTCVGATCALTSSACSGTKQECQDFGYNTGKLYEQFD